MESLDSYGRERDDTLYAMNVQFSYMSLMHRVPLSEAYEVIHINADCRREDDATGDGVVVYVELMRG